MYISRTSLKFEHKSEPNFTFKPVIMYREKDVPSWVKQSKRFKECADAGLISGGETVVNSLDTSLIKEANELGITFDDDIEQSVLEATVQRVKDSQVQRTSATTDIIALDDAEKEEKKNLIVLLATNDVIANMNWKLETLKAKVAELGLDKDIVIPTETTDEKEQKRKLIEVLLASNVPANMTFSLSTLKAKVAELDLESN